MVVRRGDMLVQCWGDTLCKYYLQSTGKDVVEKVHCWEKSKNHSDECKLVRAGMCESIEMQCSGVDCIERIMMQARGGG